MPAKSKSQRRLFGMALAYKRGELEGEVSDEIKELSKLPEKTLRDYAKTSEEDLPEKLPENMHLNPDMNLPGMGNVNIPQNPGTINQFTNQSVGSGDLMEPMKKKKKFKLLTYKKFLETFRTR